MVYKSSISKLGPLKGTLVLFFLILIIECWTGCVSTKELTQNAIYFRNISDSMLQKTAKDYEPVFQKGDILSIKVITANERSMLLFNQVPLTSSTGSGSGESAGGQSGSGYLINERGTITFPMLGEIKAVGLTRTQLTESLISKLSKYIDSAIVSVGLINYRVTVLGEVARPGTFSVPSERVSILDAIGFAGDLTIYGKRNNIRIIRNNDGVRRTGTIDLNNGDIFNSPFFYLQQNDVVYVELNNRKIPNTDQASLRNVSIGLGVISAIGVIISTINVLKR